MIALCLDPSMTGTGFALMTVPIPTDKQGLSPLKLCVIDGIAGEVENKNARQGEQERVKFLYDELFHVVNLALGKRHRIDIIAAEMAPHLFNATQKNERAIRYQFASYTVIRLFAAQMGIPLLEVAPQDSKQVSVGYAKADKEVVKRGIALRVCGDANGSWPEGWTDNAIDALTVGWWLDGLVQIHNRGEKTVLSPYLPALVASA